MKVKVDFVSNSSSASFILFVECNANTEKEFKEILEKFLLDYYNRELFLESKFVDAQSFLKNAFRGCKIEKISSNVFSVSKFVSMYNSYKDIPDWMRNMILRKEIEKDLLSFGIKDAKLKVEEHS